MSSISIKISPMSADEVALGNAAWDKMVADCANMSTNWLDEDSDDEDFLMTPTSSTSPMMSPLKVATPAKSGETANHYTTWTPDFDSIDEELLLTPYATIESPLEPEVDIETKKWVSVPTIIVTDWSSCWWPDYDYFYPDQEFLSPWTAAIMTRSEDDGETEIETEIEPEMEFTSAPSVTTFHSYYESGSSHWLPDSESIDEELPLVPTSLINPPLEAAVETALEAVGPPPVVFPLSLERSTFEDSPSWSPELNSIAEEEDEEQTPTYTELNRATRRVTPPSPPPATIHDESTVTSDATSDIMPISPEMPQSIQSTPVPVSIFNSTEYAFAGAFIMSFDAITFLLFAIVTLCIYLITRPTPINLDWSTQTVLITGGGSGIGASLAETLAERNVKTVVLSKDPVTINPDHADHLFAYTCDVSNCSEVQAVAERVHSEVGDPTIIINNAGVVKGKLLLDLTEEDINDTFGSNTLAHFWILKAFLPALIRSGKGHIVTVSSLLGLVGCAQLTDYCASKAAVIQLYQSLRFELDNRYMSPEIKSTLLLPSFITTTLFSRINLPRSWLFNLVAPHLHPSDVVEAIISALDADESRIIRLPFYTNVARVWSVGVGIVPKRVIDLVQRLVGADLAMSEYGPKPDAAERLLEEKKTLEHVK